MFGALFTIIITPIVRILEFFYTFFFEATGNQAIAVIGLSLVVTLCTLPLYMVAELWQEKERAIQEKMKGEVSRIKSTFKGDEQYMILTTFYRQCHYHPLMALRSSFSLLIQIPFFIAAYTFLSHLESLKGVSFLFIKDFGIPDATFSIGNFCINILPIAMTLINCVSGVIYSKGHGLNEKIQIFGCAALFLILLYNSPAGLVVYWTMNNVFSLAKNIFYKLKNPRQIIYILVCCVAGILVVAAIFWLRKSKFAFRAAIVVFALILPLCPLLLKSWRKVLNFIFPQEKAPSFFIFAVAALTLCILAGLAIPSILMESEPEQYCFVEDVVSPFVFLRHTLFQAIGFFLFWPMCFYFLFSNETKKGFSLIYSVAAILALLNCFAFSEDYGPILPELIFMTPQKFQPSLPMILLNAAVMLLGIFTVVLLFKKKFEILSVLYSICVFSLVVISGKNIFSINREFKKMFPPQTKTKIEKSYHLSKTGKNVIVIMQDRLFMPFIEPIFKQFPQIEAGFDGFPFYKNAVSMGSLTMVGSVGLFGGYDYTPWEINQRTDESLQKKHNEALLTMPRLFHKAGFNVAVSGLPYENYLEYPITDMYKDDDYVVRAETRGLYSDLWYEKNDFPKAEYLEHNIKRNFIFFSVFKMVPPVLRRAVYHNGYWESYDLYNDGIARFIDNYSELEYLPDMVDAESESDSLIIIDNETVHESINLPQPSFDPVDLKDKNANFDKNIDRHYATMVATLGKLSQFFERLKELDVYDNTRIIVVSDHGAAVQIPDLENNLNGLQKECFTSSILVKDFGEHSENMGGGVKVDMTFMTNADTPYLASKGIIENPTNPFTGKPLLRENKADFVKITTAPAQSTRIRNESKFTVKDSEWFTVHDNIFVNENWSHYSK